jgi:hypothetical protein
MIDEALERYPRLDVLARGHSHPFDTLRTHPSEIDRNDHLLPCLQHNRRMGIEAGFTFIAVRGPAGEGWALQGFATQDGEEVLDLGLADTPLAEGEWACLRTPTRREGPHGASLEARLRSRHGDAVNADRLPLGWHRLRVLEHGEKEPSPTVIRVVALPPGFPAEKGRHFAPAGEGWTAEDLAGWEET